MRGCRERLVEGGGEDVDEDREEEEEDGGSGSVKGLNIYPEEGKDTWTDTRYHSSRVFPSSPVAILSSPSSGFTSTHQLVVDQPGGLLSHRGTCASPPGLKSPASLLFIR